jgi:hypothetical protein
MKSLLLSLLVLSFNTVAFGSVTTVFERPYVSSCGYFSNAGVELQVYYSDPHLPQDAKVNLIYGLGSKEQNLDWERRNVIPTSKVALTNNRQANFTAALVQRSDPHRYDLLQFVWEIELANGQVYYDKGGSSAWGFYQADLKVVFVNACEPVREFSNLDFYAVARN